MSTLDSPPGDPFRTPISLVEKTINPVIHHPQPRKFICKRKDCGNGFRTKSGLESHSKTHFPDKYLLKCFDCEFTSFQKGNLAKHLSSVHRRRLDGEFLTPDFSCPSCHEGFLTEANLKSHLVRKHLVGGGKPFKCQLCQYTATEKSDLRKHIRIRHTGERPYGCEFCEFRTHTASGMARHRRSHTNSKPFHCDLCSVTFADKKRLTAHVMKHNDEKPFKCPTCKYSTNRNDNLKTHVRRNHTETGSSSTFQIPSFVQITTEENPYSIL